MAKRCTFVGWRRAAEKGKVGTENQVRAFSAKFSSRSMVEIVHTEVKSLDMDFHETLCRLLGNRIPSGSAASFEGTRLDGI